MVHMSRTSSEKQDMKTKLVATGTNAGVGQTNIDKRPHIFSKCQYEDKCYHPENVAELLGHRAKTQL